MVHSCCRLGDQDWVAMTCWCSEAMNRFLISNHYWSGFFFKEGTQMSDKPASDAELTELCSCSRKGQWFSLSSVWPRCWSGICSPSLPQCSIQQFTERFTSLCGSKMSLPPVPGRVWYSCSHQSRREAGQGCQSQGRERARQRPQKYVSSVRLPRSATSS